MEIKVLCHHNLFSQEILVKYTAENWSNARHIYLQPDGLFNDRFAPGIYELELLDGNGGQPEYRTTEITEGYLTQVVFIGHAISGAASTPTITPTTTPTIAPCEWHPGYWTYEMKWTCRDGDSISILCCRWIVVPVWHEGWEIC
jgi:hypothetical protein